jgi:methylmalonyl-CoA mutase C-terminal domain/subunit
MSKAIPIKVILAKLGLDGHDRGVQVVAQALVDAGMEVIYTGLRQTAQSLVRAALEEDVDVIGVSSLSGAHQTLFPALVAECKKEKLEVILFAGGIIPEEEIPDLLEQGFDAIFTPGSSMEDIVSRLNELVKK